MMFDQKDDEYFRDFSIKNTKMDFCAVDDKYAKT